MNIKEKQRKSEENKNEKNFAKHHELLKRLREVRATRQVQSDIEEARQRISEERLRAPRRSSNGYRGLHNVFASLRRCCAKVEQEGSQRRRSVAHEYEKFRALAEGNIQKIKRMKTK